MERTDNTPPAVRVCSGCKEEKPYTTEYYPALHGAIYGSLCRVCRRQRLKARTVKQGQVASSPVTLADLIGSEDSPAKASQLPATRKAKGGSKALRKADIGMALQAGADALNKNAQSVLERVLAYAADPKSLHHEWALKLAADRLFPKKMYQDLGEQAAGSSGNAGRDKRPAVTVIIQPATVPAPAASPIIDVTPTERSE